MSVNLNMWSGALRNAACSLPDIPVDPLQWLVTCHNFPDDDPCKDHDPSHCLPWDQWSSQSCIVRYCLGSVKCPAAWPCFFGTGLPSHLMQWHALFARQETLYFNGQGWQQASNEDPKHQLVKMTWGRGRSGAPRLKTSLALLTGCACKAQLHASETERFLCSKYWQCTFKMPVSDMAGISRLRPPPALSPRRAVAHRARRRSRHH